MSFFQIELSAGATVVAFAKATILDSVAGNITKINELVRDS